MTRPVAIIACLCGVILVPTVRRALNTPAVPQRSPNEVDECQATVMPPAESRRDDYVELTRGPCYAMCPAYWVRISRRGVVEWMGESEVVQQGLARTTIDAGAAAQLIERFRSTRFWSLCCGYSRPIEHLSAEIITVRTAGRVMQVSDYGNAAPAWLRDLRDEVDRVADTHRWRHGEAKTEPLQNMQDERLPKKGVTPLMQYAADGNLAQVRRLMSEGADLEAQDESGWTVLMYAAADFDAKAVPLLLEFGASPNRASLRGHTPLLVAAAHGRLLGDLVKAGANINHRTRDGVTALMMLAARSESEAISRALQLGAKPWVRDRAGRTAADYAKLGDCGKSPLRESWYKGESAKCGQHVPLKLRETLSLLQLK